MAVRNESFEIVCDPVTQDDVDRYSRLFDRRAKILSFMLRAPRDLIWGVPAGSGPGPHVWEGDQA